MEEKVVLDSQLNVSDGSLKDSLLDTELHIGQSREYSLDTELRLWATNKEPGTGYKQ